MASSLEEFLRDRFTTGELRMFLRKLGDGQQKILYNLPGEIASHNEVVMAATDLLMRNGDVREVSFYETLVDERPRWPAEIRAIASEHAVELDLAAICAKWEEGGRSESAASLRAALARADDFVVVGTRATRRQGDLPGLHRRAHAGIEVPTVAPGPALGWRERYRRDIVDLVLNLQGPRAVKLLLDLARTCGLHDSGIPMLGVQLQLAEGKADRQDLFRQILVKMDDLLGRHLSETERPHRPRVAPTVDADDQVLVCGNGLEKRYPGATSVALRGVTLTISRGALVGVVGPNSAGKSTLLNILRGALAPSSGELKYPGLARPTRAGELDWRKIRPQIRHVVQRPPRWHGRMIDNLRAWAACIGDRGEHNDREVGYVLDRMDLRPHGEKTWDEMSGGVRMRFELARAWLGESMLLLLDEPLAPLDAHMQHTLLADLRDYTKFPRRPAVVLSAQNPAEIETHIDLAICLHGDGEAYYVGPPRGFARDATHRVFEVLSRDPERLRGAVEAIDGCAMRTIDGVALISAPIHAEAAIERLRAHLYVSVELNAVRDITDSLRLFMWEGRR